MKKKYKIPLFIIILLISILAGCLVAKYFIKDDEGVIEVKTLETIEGYDYKITSEDSEYYTNEFKILKEILSAEEIDEVKYASQVAKMYIIDLYSLSTKINKYDIGGDEFYHPNKLEMYKQKVIDTLYSTVEDNTYGDRKQPLPIVNSVEVLSVEETTYTMDSTEVSAYEVALKWTYEEDMGYDSEGTIIVVKEDNKLYVVDYQSIIKSED